MVDRMQDMRVMPDVDVLLKRAPQCMSCPFGAGVALLDLRTNVYFTVNTVGAAVWDLLATPQSSGKIVEGICAIYDVPPQVAQRDVAALLADLARRGLVEVV